MHAGAEHESKVTPSRAGSRAVQVAHAGACCSCLALVMRPDWCSWHVPVVAVCARAPVSRFPQPARAAPRALPKLCRRAQRSFPSLPACTPVPARPRSAALGGRGLETPSCSTLLSGSPACLPRPDLPQEGVLLGLCRHPLPRGARPLPQGQARLAVGLLGAAQHRCRCPGWGCACVVAPPAVAPSRPRGCRSPARQRRPSARAGAHLLSLPLPSLFKTLPNLQAQPRAPAAPLLPVSVHHW